ncbi:MAG: 16S rRNA (uracil(1498)-N(3))-methyltransferase [Alicyclobacillus sp.]|nr:16S rRNA (uracil(1498)-N(3))-methyltransferase [Alicyclobacillus sp.]
MNPRVFLEHPVSVGEVVTVSGPAGHHLARVLRLRPGERVAIACAGRAWEGVATAVDGAAATVDVRVDRDLPGHEPPLHLYLVQGLPKADKMENIVQHGTELGFAGYLVVASDRSVVQLDARKWSARIERWQKIAAEASAQAQRDFVPLVRHVERRSDLARAIAGLAPDCILFLDEEERELSLRSALPSAHPPSCVVLCVGPEGGWSDAERTFWRNELGARAVTLGPRILRTETAGLVAGAAVLHHFGGLGG